MTFMNKLNLILVTPTATRSGSLFLQSLFDFHPEIISLPKIFFDYENEEFLININQKNNIEIIDEFIVKHSDIFNLNILSRYHKNITNTNSIDKDVFKQNFITLCDKMQLIKITDYKMIFELIYLAYGLTLGYDIEKVKYIYIHIHSFKANSTKFDNLDFFYKSYPDLKLILSSRNIKENLAGLMNKDSYFVYKNTIGYKKLILIEEVAFNDIYENLLSIISKSNQIIIIDLFTLHKLSSNAMKQIANLLEIKYNESLCSSTYASFTWQGNSSNGKFVSTFNINKKPNNYKEKFTKKDIYLIELFTSYVSKFYGYEHKELKFFQKSIGAIYFLFLWMYPAIIYPYKHYFNIYKNLKTKDEIFNTKYKKLPFFIAKKMVFFHAVIVRTIKFYKTKNSLKRYILAYKINQKFKHINDKINIYYVNDKKLSEEQNETR